MGRYGPSVGEPGYLPYCGNCPRLQRMTRGLKTFKCVVCGMETRNVNGEDMFDRTAPIDEQEMLRRADAAVAPIMENGGMLLPEQAAKFQETLEQIAREIQAELESYSPIAGVPMSEGLRERLWEETDVERRQEDMSDTDLWVAWLRS